MLTCWSVLYKALIPERSHLDHTNPQRQSGYTSHRITEAQSAPYELLAICTEDPKVEVESNGEEEGDEDPAENDVGIVWDASSGDHCHCS